ncbi:MAG: twin transmembrane helix small protein [Alphaproteobacteria bacterium]|nr:twin transmembrane helix small protein [Alphaproteobacteria bacterium]MBV8549311.1 twin transmembrane helix small protein [Alphaproteobacteria bacterium]
MNTSSPSFTLMVLMLLAVLGVLVLGLISMAKGGTFARKYGNRLMQARIALQGLALLLFVVLLVTAKH